jgi:hypothetical protein
MSTDELQRFLGNVDADAERLQRLRTAAMALPCG